MQHRGKLLFQVDFYTLRIPVFAFSYPMKIAISPIALPFWIVNKSNDTLYFDRLEEQLLLLRQLINISSVNFKLTLSFKNTMRGECRSDKCSHFQLKCYIMCNVYESLATWFAYSPQAMLFVQRRKFPPSN